MVFLLQKSCQAYVRDALKMSTLLRRNKHLARVGTNFALSVVSTWGLLNMDHDHDHHLSQLPITALAVSIRNQEDLYSRSLKIEKLLKTSTKLEILCVTNASLTFFSNFENQFMMTSSCSLCIISATKYLSMECQCNLNRIIMFKAFIFV